MSDSATMFFVLFLTLIVDKLKDDGEYKVLIYMFVGLKVKKDRLPIKSLRLLALIN